MSRIGVKLVLTQTQSKEWTYRSFQARELSTILTKFKLRKIFPPERADQIQNLWRNFMQLYQEMRYGKDLQLATLKSRAQAWLKEFTTPCSGESEKMKITSPVFTELWT